MDPSNEQQQHHHLHHQEMGSDETLESMLECRKAQQQQQQQEKKTIRPAEESLKCPRCDSTNTKFCYYNNYSLTQPRYFCKSCRRYWTKGGTLRNVPVGGGCRKNNKRSSSSSSSLSSSKRAQDQSMISSPPNGYNNNNNPLSSLITGLSSYDHQSDQISLAIARLQNQNQNQNHHHFGQMGFEHGYSIFGNNNNNVHHDDHVDAMRGGTGGYFENPSSINGFHNHQLFGGIMGQNENGGFLRNLGLINGSEEILGINSSMAAAYGGDQELGGNCGIATSSSTAVSTVKQEGENRVLMAGFPWQFAGGDQTGNMVDFEPPVKPNWSGFGSSSWHGLLNSPLM